MDDDFQAYGKHLCEKFKLLYTHGQEEPWTTVFRLDFQNTWIQAVVQSIEGEGLPGIKRRVDGENLTHEIKTQVNNNAKSM